MLVGSSRQPERDGRRDREDLATLGLYQLPSALVDHPVMSGAQEDEVFQLVPARASRRRGGDRSTWSLFIARRLVLMGRIICRKCGDDLSYVSNHWIHLRLPIAKAWTHPVEPVEAGSGGDAGTAGTAGAPVPARPNPPTLSGAAAMPLTFDEEEPPTDVVARRAPPR